MVQSKETLNRPQPRNKIRIRIKTTNKWIRINNSDPPSSPASSSCNYINNSKMHLTSQDQTSHIHLLFLSFWQVANICITLYSQQFYFGITIWICLAIARSESMPANPVASRHLVMSNRRPSDCLLAKVDAHQIACLLKSTPIEIMQLKSWFIGQNPFFSV